MDSQQMPSNEQAWQVIVNQNEELRKLKRGRLFGLIKPCLIAWGVGIFTPIFFQFAILWLLPAPIRETYTVVTGWWSDVTLGMQCQVREFNKGKNK